MAKLDVFETIRVLMFPICLLRKSTFGFRFATKFGMSQTFSLFSASPPANVVLTVSETEPSIFMLKRVQGPLLSVCVTTHGYASNFLDFLGRSEVPTEKFEFIFVNDGDESEAWFELQEFIETETSLSAVFVSTKNRGLSAARNEAVQHASGEFVVFLDGDDELNFQALIESVEIYGKPEVALVFTHNVAMKKKAGVLTRGWLSFRLFYRIWPPAIPLAWGCLFSQPIHSLVSPRIASPRFDESFSFGEDLVFWSRLIQSGIKLEFLPIATATYIFHPGQMTRDIRGNSSEALRSRRASFQILRGEFKS